MCTIVHAMVLRTLHRWRKETAIVKSLVSQIEMAEEIGKTLRTLSRMHCWAYNRQVTWMTMKTAEEMKQM